MLEIENQQQANTYFQEWCLFVLVKTIHAFSHHIFNFQNNLMDFVFGFAVSNH